MRTNFTCYTILLVFTATSVATAAEKVKLKKVKARAITLQVPESWKPVEVKSKFRAAQLAVPGKDADSEGAELVVFHFGGPTGGIKANISRWVGQFHEKGRKSELSRGKSTQGDYILSNVSGTWKKPIGPPFARKTEDKPGSRVLGMIVVTVNDDEKDYYFLKLSGPDALVAQHAKTLRAAIGADVKSEKPFDLKDAEN